MEKSFIHKKCTREPTPYKLLQSKKLTKSTLFEEEKLENVHDTVRIKNKKDKQLASHLTEQSGVTPGK
jgi:hypothetical protein